MQLARFTVLGEPVGEGRPRFARRGAHVHTHAAPKSALWRLLAADQMAAEWAREPLTQTVEVSIVAMTKRPKSLPKREPGELARSCKPDVDNIAKSALDALVQAGVLADDCQVCDLHVRRRTCAVGQVPHLTMAVHGVSV